VARRQPITVRECWSRLQQIDEVLAELPAERAYRAKMVRLIENRKWFAQQLERSLVTEGYFSK
jgi:hypothetical protein